MNSQLVRRQESAQRPTRQRARSRGWPASRRSRAMTIGSVAPPLTSSMEVSDGGRANSNRSPIQSWNAFTSLNSWATWCGPCISSIGPPAETQTPTRQDVQLIPSISGPGSGNVETFLKRKYTPRSPAKNTDADAKSDADADDESDADDDARKPTPS